MDISKFGKIMAPNWPSNGMYTTPQVKLLLDWLYHRYCLHTSSHEPRSSDIWRSRVLLKIETTMIYSFLATMVHWYAVYSVQCTLYTVQWHVRQRIIMISLSAKDAWGQWKVYTVHCTLYYDLVCKLYIEFVKLTFISHEL